MISQTCALQGFGCLISAVVHNGAALLIVIQISVEHIENVHIVIHTSLQELQIRN